MFSYFISYPICRLIYTVNKRQWLEHSYSRSYLYRQFLVYERFKLLIINVDIVCTIFKVPIHFLQHSNIVMISSAYHHTQDNCRNQCHKLNLRCTTVSTSPLSVVSNFFVFNKDVKYRVRQVS